MTIALLFILAPLLLIAAPAAIVAAMQFAEDRRARRYRR